MSEPEILTEGTPPEGELGPDTAEGAEAEEAESTPEATPAPEPEPGEGEAEQVEGHPAEPQGLSQKAMEKALDKLDREAKRHRGRVEEIMGEDFSMLLDCPLCDQLTPGQIMIGPMVPERFPAVREFMGDAAPRELRPDPKSSQCKTCGGQGVVDTGSKVQGQEALLCETCAGRGWTGSRGQMSTMTGPTVQVSPEANGPTGPGLPEVDPPEVAKLKSEGYMVVKLAQPT